MKDSKKSDSNDRSNETKKADMLSRPDLNPPRTTKGKWTAPKFGSAGSGGAEFEPGPEKD
jgi:hypothetical protein